MTEHTHASTPASTSTWWVTGASRGLGLELVPQLLERGHRVVATTRSTDRLLQRLDQLDLSHQTAGLDTSRLLPVTVDLGDERSVAEAVRRATEVFGGIDVVVNNAGYGYLAAVEETSDADARAMFDVQVHGVLNVLRATLPGMRARRSGHVVNVSSILGLTTFAGWGLYCAGKYAVEALTTALAVAVADLGIRVNLVEPGYLRTDFLDPVSVAVPTETLDAYPAVREMTEAHLAMAGTQPGDPARAAAAIIQVVARGDAPLHQILGSDSYALAGSRIASLSADVEAARDLALTTDFPAAGV